MVTNYRNKIKKPTDFRVNVKTVNFFRLRQLAKISKLLKVNIRELLVNQKLLSYGEYKNTTERTI